jgi:nucleoside-diphosphate-sugar epimerase
VRKFVFSGVIHPSISAMVNHRAKQPVEEALYGSSMDFSVLQPAMFISVKVCWVDYRDVAEVAALAMTGDELSYGVFELCAPGMVDRVQMAAMISEEIGRRIEAQETPRSQWASRLPEGPIREGLTRMMAHYDEHGFPGGNALVLRTILGREPRSLKEYFHELATHQA